MNYKFLIYFSYSYAIPTGIPLEKEIKRRGYDVWWFCDLDSQKKAIPPSSNSFDHIEQVIAYEPHIVLTITDLVPDFISGLKVQIFHGFDPEKRSFKKGHCRIRGLFDLYCSQGPSTTRVFLQHQITKPHFEVIETGWSKVDPLFPIERNAPNETPVIFIASTFSKKLSLAYNDEVHAKISQLAVSKKYHFLMVLHPKLPQEIKEKWIQLEGDYFTYYNTTDLIPLMKRADIMFSDTTSAIQEFGLQDKPIVTFNHFVPKPYLINVTDTNSIESSFQKALAQPEEVLSLLNAYNKELHPYQDGNSSQRVVEACIEFLHRDKLHFIKKPLNLVRRYQIRKQLKHFTFKSFRKPFVMKK